MCNLPEHGEHRLGDRSRQILLVYTTQLQMFPWRRPCHARQVKLLPLGEASFVEATAGQHIEFEQERNRWMSLLADTAVLISSESLHKPTDILVRQFRTMLCPMHIRFGGKAVSCLNGWIFAVIVFAFDCIRENPLKVLQHVVCSWVIRGHISRSGSNTSPSPSRFRGDPTLSRMMLASIFRIGTLPIVGIRTCGVGWKFSLGTPVISA